MALRSLYFYMLFTSAVFMYGIGIRKVVVVSNNITHYLAWFSRTLVTTMSIICAVWFISVTFLSPYGLMELFPFFAVIVCVLISQLTYELWNLLSKLDTPEFALTFCTVILAVGEGTSFIDSLAIGLSSILAFYLGAPLLYTFRWRMQYSDSNIVFRGGALVFFSIAVMLIVLFGINISWLNFGAF